MKKSPIVVIGSNGQLGSDLVAHWSRMEHEVHGLTHADIRVEDADSVRTTLAALKPGLVLNTAAFHNVPRCEEEPDRSFAVNAKGSLNVARVCEDVSAQYVYYSTDYVFDGEKHKPYTESDLPNPLNVYAVTKLAGEYGALNYCRGGFVFRVSGIYGAVPCRAKGGNFITTMARLAKEKPEVRVVNDEFLTPTPTSEIASASFRVLEKGSPGLYHVTSEGECSWYEFARVIFETLKLSTPLHATTVAEFSSPVRRPFYSVLENDHMKRMRVSTLPHWRESLVSFLKSTY